MLNEKEIEKSKKLATRRKNDVGGLAVIFDALSDPGRFTMFCLFLDHEELCVTDVANICEVTVAAASQQLKILEMSGLLNKERMGQMICYSLKKSNPLVTVLVRVIQEKKFSFKDFFRF